MSVSVSMSVKQRAECLGTFRWVEVQLMEMLARWVPTTPEMEVKILFGRHIWDCAQHADGFGKRAIELRAPLNYTLPAKRECMALIQEVAGLVETSDRVNAFYDVVCPGIVDQYRHYIEKTDALMDEPTIRILENVLRDYGRMAEERNRLVPEGLASMCISKLSNIKEREQAIGAYVVHGDVNHLNRGTRA